MHKKQECVELRELSTEELGLKLVELKSLGLKMRLRKSVGQLSTSHEIRKVKKSIARVSTFIIQRSQEA